MEKVTVTIVALNEEDYIGDCLESVSWADEIIVSDSGSTDRTVEICRSHGAKVFSDKWLGFGGQKNLCAGRAAHGWILNLDADERVTPELKFEIRDVLEGPDKDGYHIPRKNYLGKVWIRYCWYPDYTLRLYRKERGAYTNKCHASVAVKGPGGRLKNPLVHLSYRDITDYMERLQKYSTLAAKDMLEEGREAAVADLVLRPQAAFLKMYVMKRGFLDGTLGFILSLLNAYYTLAKYSKLWEMKRGKAAS